MFEMKGRQVNPMDDARAEVAAVVENLSKQAEMLEAEAADALARSKLRETQAIGIRAHAEALRNRLDQFAA